MKTRAMVADNVYPDAMAKKTKSKTSASRYTDPELRERIKARLKKGTKGGASGQWSARKSQLLATEYKKAGGGYTAGKGRSQKSLDQWTHEQWQTKSGSKKARSKSGTQRYLPKKAWEQLSESEQEATQARKRAGSKSGKQYVANTAKAKKARKKVSKAGKSSARSAAKTSADKKSPTKRSAAKKKPSRADKKTAARPRKNLKAKSFKRGDHVEWTKIGGSTTGKVIRKITRDTRVHGHQVRASAGQPQYEVATDATGKRAAHKPDKMKKLTK